MWLVAILVALAGAAVAAQEAPAEAPDATEVVAEASAAAEQPDETGGSASSAAEASPAPGSAGDGPMPPGSIGQQITRGEAFLEDLDSFRLDLREREAQTEIHLTERMEDIVALESALRQADRRSRDVEDLYDRLLKMLETAIAELNAEIDRALSASQLPEYQRDASKILVIDFVNGVGQYFPVALPGRLCVAEQINIW